MSTGISTFSRAHPLALGTVQIMIGLMVFLFGVVSAIKADSLAEYSGAFVCGAGFYITAGSLTVAAGKSSNRCLMDTTLAFNMTATVAACTATILFGLKVVGQIIPCACLAFPQCNEEEILVHFLGIFLAVIHFLEFIISIVVSVYVCKSTCNCCNKQPSDYIVSGNAPQYQLSYSAPVTVVQLPLQGLPTYIPGSTSVAHRPPPMKNVSNPADGKSSPGLTDPPPYSEARSF